MKNRTGRIMWKYLSVILAMLLSLGLCLTGCTGGGGSGGSGSSAKADDPLVGKYLAVVGQMLGVSLTNEDLGGFSIELQNGGKAVLTVEGESHNVKWKSDESTVTLMVDGEEIVGERGEDHFVVKDMLGMGMDITFAKEGTPAADPVQYLPEAEKFMLQDWQSVSVVDILGDPTDEIAPDALKATFRGDHTADFTLEGENLGTFKWSNVDDWGSLNDEGAPNITWKVKEDGLSIDCTKNDTYYTFFCPKDPSSYTVDDKAAATGDKDTETEPADTETEEAETEAEADLKEIKDGKDGKDGLAGAAAGFAAKAGKGKKSSSPYAEYWDGDWFGWYIFESCDGDYEILEGNWYDMCATITVKDDDTGDIVLWDEDGSADDAVGVVEVSFGPGTTAAGCMKSESGSFLTDEENVAHADWLVDPGASSVSDYDHMIEIDGVYEDENGSFRYYIYMRPWGTDWDDIRAVDESLMPNAYDSWYVNVKDDPMPKKIGEEDLSFIDRDLYKSDDSAKTGSSSEDEDEEEAFRFDNFTVMSNPEYYPAGKKSSLPCYVLKMSGQENDDNPGYIIDKNTVLDNPEELDGWQKGDDAFTWMDRLCNDSSYTPHGVYDIRVSNNHVDVVYGLYWWD